MNFVLAAALAARTLLHLSDAIVVPADISVGARADRLGGFSHFGHFFDVSSDWAIADLGHCAIGLGVIGLVRLMGMRCNSAFGVVGAMIMAGIGMALVMVRRVVFGHAVICVTSGLGQS